MKKGLIIALLILTNISFGQDTTLVQTFTYDSIFTRRATFEFPAELEDKQFEKVLMYYNIKCDPLTPWDSYNCGEWDYLAYSHIYDHTGQLDSNAVEGWRYLLNGESPLDIPYVETPYYHYFERYEKFINFLSEDDTEHIIAGETIASNLPFGTANAVQNTQILWRNTELSGVGLVAGEISKLRFDVGTVGDEMQRLTIKMKHTTVDEVSSFDDEDWTLVYDRETTFVGIGLNTFDLTTPFLYDGTSNIILDISFENVSGGSDNTVLSTTTPFNSVISTNQKLGYLNVEPSEWAQVELSAYDFEDQVTISFWANGDEDYLPINTSVIEAGDSLDNRILNIHFPWSNSRFYWDAGEGSGADRIDELASASEIGGEWHHWAFTKNETTGVMNIYKDGTLWLTGTDKNRVVGEVNKFFIGANRTLANGWAGKLDEFRIWDTELAEGTINEWMTKKVDASHPNYADLVTYYDFDEVPSLIDRSGNERDAMLNTPSMVQFYEGSRAGFEIDDVRPNISFVQGTYTTELDSNLVLDSMLVNPIDILEYEVDGRKFTIIDIIHKSPEGYSYTYNHLGEKTADSIWHEADVNLSNELLVYYQAPFEIINQYEIGRFITPYGIGFSLGPDGFTYVYDVTDYQSLLMGDVDFQAHNTQELIDIQFAFIEGTPPRDVIEIERLWNGRGSFLYRNLDDDVNLSATEVDLNPEGEMFKVRSRITGHGHNGSNNCCEWGFGVGRDHELLVDGTLRDTWEIWQEEECGDNPNISQGGTWPYAREGWCPGDIVEEHEFDITPFVTPGTTSTIDYDIEDVPASDPDQGNGNYVIAMHMITYGSANFNLDAAVVDVLNPNDWEYYSKWNPTCQNPRILIKNTGSTALTSCKIDVWIGGYDNVITYDWTGDLAFLEEEMVEIPITADWWADWEGKLMFNARVRLPNGGTDEYSNNDIYRVSFEAAPVINEPFYIWLKTNDAASENELYLKDQNGDIVFSRTTLENSTDYKDTMNLPAGCYTVELYDSDHDGISFWASGETAGFLRLREVDGSMIHLFDADFGHYTKYSFSVGYAIGIDELEETNYGLEVYPNPNDGAFNLTLDNFKGDNIALAIYNELGAIVYSEAITNMNADAYVQRQLDLTDLAEGTYFLHVISDNQSAVKRIIIQ